MADFTRLERKHTHHRPAVHNERAYARPCPAYTRAYIAQKYPADLPGLRVNLIDPINSHLTLKYRDLNQSTPELSITPAEARRGDVNDAENRLHRAKLSYRAPCSSRKIYALESRVRTSKRFQSQRQSRDFRSPRESLAIFSRRNAAYDIAT